MIISSIINHHDYQEANESIIKNEHKYEHEEYKMIWIWTWNDMNMNNQATNNQPNQAKIKLS